MPRKPCLLFASECGGEACMTVVTSSVVQYDVCAKHWDFLLKWWRLNIELCRTSDTAYPPEHYETLLRLNGERP